MKPRLQFRLRTLLAVTAVAGVLANRYVFELRWAIDAWRRPAVTAHADVTYVDHIETGGTGAIYMTFKYFPGPWETGNAETDAARGRP